MLCVSRRISINTVFSRHTRLIYLCGKSTAILYDTHHQRAASRPQERLVNRVYVSENRIFTDADDYSMEIELPIVDCPQNLDIFEMITRKDVELACVLARQNCQKA